MALENLNSRSFTRGYYRTGFGSDFVFISTTYLCNKIDRFSFALWRLSKTVSQTVALQTYHGYVISVISYSILLWGTSFDTGRLVISQKRCIRSICNMSSLFLSFLSTLYRPLFKILKLLTVPSIYFIFALL